MAAGDIWSLINVQGTRSGAQHGAAGTVHMMFTKVPDSCGLASTLRSYFVAGTMREREDNR
ncbi:MAG: hypothetical protein NVSMB32_08590 [Actinomycetota bacterium]